MTYLCTGQNLSLPRIDDIAVSSVNDAKRYHNTTAATRSKDVLSKEQISADDDDDDERLKRCTVRIAGMTCGSCVANIERHLHVVKGECFAITYA